MYTGGIYLGNNEKFINRWSKYRKKGKLKYILIDCIIYWGVYWGFGTLLILVEGKEFHNLLEKSDDFIFSFIVYIICAFIMWKKNEDKYNKITNNNNV